jgi:hypothetical protein
MQLTKKRLKAVKRLTMLLKEKLAMQRSESL